MSRIGKLPISIPEKVNVSVSNENVVTVTGPLGELTQKIDSDLTVKVNEGVVELVRPTEQKRHRAMHGLFRSLVNNMVEGVSEGFTVQQELVGVGYRADVRGQQLVLGLGYSHDIIVELPKEINVEAKTEKRSNPVITLKSADKQLIGHVAAKIRSLRPPEPFKGKGIRFVGELIRRKAGKAASAK